MLSAWWRVRAAEGLIPWTARECPWGPWRKRVVASHLVDHVQHAMMLRTKRGNMHAITYPGMAELADAGDCLCAFAEGT